MKPYYTQQVFSLKAFLIITILIISNIVFAQKAGMITGRVTDENNLAVELVNVSILGEPGGTSTAADGSYSLQVPAAKQLKIVFSFVGYKTDTAYIKVAAGEKLRVNRTITSTATELGRIVIEDRNIRNTNLIRIDARTVNALPTASSGIEALLKTMPGVVSNNELSSQYSVRGGNYDENLVYVNDIEIYRPFLVRTSQQEGLSFLNSDLVSSVLFSAGGFDAKYGDKLSSVLDIKYKHPTKFAASATASLLGATVHMEGISKDKRFTYLAGARYKTNQYLLNAMETKGSYKPVFVDFQSLLTYTLSDKLELAVLGYISSNKYTLIPESRETKFGTYFTPLRLTMYFEGQEVDRYDSRMGAITLTQKPNKNLQIKWITSVYNSRETESFDVLAEYYIALLDNQPTATDSIEVVETKGVGGFFNHARNQLDMTVINAENRYSYSKGKNYALWGIKYQHEIIADRMNEWQRIDSSAYSIPYNPGTPGQPGNLTDFVLNYHLQTDTNISSNRYTAFAQNTWTLDRDSTQLAFTAGIRFNYWDFNKQFIVSPRVSLSYKPNWEKDMMLRFSAGYYYQPPFYRELRNLQGKINPNLRAQKSIQFVAGNDFNFHSWGRPFKFVTEVYYKYLTELVPYQVDNVRIQYLGINGSKGYAYGIDMKVNGNFVKGVESWASLSYMKTAEDLYNDYYVESYNAAGEVIHNGFTEDITAVSSDTIYPGYIPRPTDQRITFGLFFQDFLPMNPTFKMNIGLYFGTGLPTGAPNTPLYTHTYRLPPYRRVDIGLSKQIIGGEALQPKKGFFGGFKSLWITAEILNLLQVNNTVSYTWVRDVNNNMYGVPNYLTPRQINIKIGAEF
ncbi:MAG: TonB-dependent receptor [Bacteroidales bacterium]|nr:TonB-dependent receptor [Bacteroidales bacterium]